MVQKVPQYLLNEVAAIVNYSAKMTAEVLSELLNL